MAFDRDAYFTPQATANKIVQDLIDDNPEILTRRIVEPSAGAGSFLKSFAKHGKKIEGYDIHPKSSEIRRHDFLTDDLDLTGAAVVGNPPYGKRQRLALDFIDRSFEQGAESVSFLLTGSFIAFSNLSRIKQPCKVKTVRFYSVKFENDEGEEVLCFAEKIPAVFITLEKAETRIRDEHLPEIFKIGNPDRHDFVTAFKFFSEKLPADDFGQLTADGQGRYWMKDIEKYRKKKYCPFTCSELLDQNFIIRMASLFVNGSATYRTLNFWTKHRDKIIDMR